MTEIPHLQKRECKDIRGIGSDTMLTLFDATKCTRYKHKGQHTTKIKRTKTYKKCQKLTYAFTSVHDRFAEYTVSHYYRATVCVSAVFAVVRCLSVCLSVRHVCILYPDG